VRAVQYHPILSTEWFRLVDIFAQLVRLLTTEGRMPSDPKVLEVQGRNSESEGTLWDQAAHENILRIFVEESKVNVCLRMMHDFKKWQYDSKVAKEAIAERACEMKVEERLVESKCKRFEESLGVLFARVLTHVEALQLLDVQMLLEHMALVLSFCERYRKARLNCSPTQQEMLIVCYASSFFRHMEALKNDSLLDKACELRIVAMTVSHIVNHFASEYPASLYNEISDGLAALCDNEGFRTEWQRFFIDSQGELEMEQLYFFLRLKEVVDPLITANPERRKELRPILDFFKVLSKKLGS